jgi:two-component system OmpR family response regulator
MTQGKPARSGHLATSVLLVDDEAPIADSLARVLRAKGYDVQVAMTGGQALELISTLSPDVVLLDISLPDITGWEVLRRVRARGAHVPVITFSASPLTPERVSEFRPAGVLIKPFSLDAAVRLIEQVTKSASQQRGNR